jgi:hypothetical protein
MSLAARKSSTHAFCMLLLLAACTSTERKSTDDTRQRGTDEFTRIAQVLKGPRCMNCHPAGNAPRQGDERRLHDFGVTRGPDDHGAAGLTCSACHQDANQPESGVPGAPHWHVAPLRMAWEGLSDDELCRSLLDPERNGHRTLDDLVHHMTEDAFIDWAWEPGGLRAPPAMPRADFDDLVRSWAAKGAACPKATD